MQIPLRNSCCRCGTKRVAGKLHGCMQREREKFTLGFRLLVNLSAWCIITPGAVKARGCHTPQVDGGYYQNGVWLLESSRAQHGVSVDLAQSRDGTSQYPTLCIIIPGGVKASGCHTSQADGGYYQNGAWLLESSRARLVVVRRARASSQMHAQQIRREVAFLSHRWRTRGLWMVCGAELGQLRSGRAQNR